MNLSPMETLAVAWPQPMTEVQVELYADALADLDPEAVGAAIGWLVLTVEWRPSIATIRRTVIEAQADYPDESEAWAAALEWGDLSSWVPVGAGGGVTTANLEPLHAAVRAAYEVAGVEHQPTFRAAYRDARERLTREAMTAAVTLELGR